MIKAIETAYKGYRFRSRLEARWAVFFDALGVKWEYEKEGYDLGAAGWYLPDFWLPELGCWIEIKPSTAIIPDCRIFLAGKMNGWRSALKTHGYHITGPNDSKRIERTRDEYLEDDKLVYIHESFRATGFELDSQDGVSTACSYLWEENKRAIHYADHIFVWIDTDNALGTVAEAAWAVGMDKEVLLAAPEITKESDLGHGSGCTTEWWVLEQLASRVLQCRNPQAAFDYWFPPATEDHIVKSAALSAGGTTVLNFHGAPWEEGRDQVVKCRGGIVVQRNAPCPLHRGDHNRWLYAINAARAARFEHGEGR